MKIELEIPDKFLDDVTVRVFAGIQMVAYQSPGNKKWYIKTENCQQCGKCCTHLGPTNTWITNTQSIDGRCKFLTDLPDGRRLCGLGISRPFGCAVTTDMHEENPNCPVYYREV